MAEILIPGSELSQHIRLYLAPYFFLPLYLISSDIFQRMVTAWKRFSKRPHNFDQTHSNWLWEVLTFEFNQ